MDKPNLLPELIDNPAETQPDPADSEKPVKKKFITPQISVPVDVLEATTFFVAVDSGQVP